MKHVLVVTKATPDTAATIDLDANGTVTWGNAALVVNPWDEYAITEAVLLKEKYGVRTTILCVGPEIHLEALRQGLAIGVDQAILVWDAAFSGQDSLGYARTLAAAVQKLADVDLILFGKEFADLGSDAHVYQVARALGWTAFGGVSKFESLDFEARTVQIARQVEEGTEKVSARLPCVAAVLKGINEPRYPSFINIRKATKATIPVWGRAELSLDQNVGGGDAASIRATGFQKLPVRTGKVEIIDGADEAEKAKQLVARLIDAKVL